jgi:hypothetical protein
MKISELFAESRKADSNEKRSIQKAFDKNWTKRYEHLSCSEEQGRRERVVFAKTKLKHARLIWLHLAIAQKAQDSFKQTRNDNRQSPAARARKREARGKDHRTTEDRTAAEVLN